MGPWFERLQTAVNQGRRCSLFDFIVEISVNEDSAKAKPGWLRTFPKPQWLDLLVPDPVLF